ncbi:MAG: globin domain-containing protein [Chitinophagaceae bacterium]
MTERQIELVQQSWQLVAAMDTYQTGNLFYNRLFEMAPSVKPLFHRNTQHDQSGKMIYMINYIVRNLSNHDIRMIGIERLARQHTGYGVQEEHYTMLGRALLWTMQNLLASTWNKELQQAWIVCYTKLAEAMIKASAMNEVADEYVY